MIDAGVLARPIVELLESFGTGMVMGASADPAAALRLAAAGLDSASRLGSAALAELAAAWHGPAAFAAATKGSAARRSAVELAERGESMAHIADAAAASIRAGVVELESILQSFLAIATAAAPTLVTPAGRLMLVAAAMEHLDRALAVVARVRAELAGHTARLAEFVAPADTPAEAAATTPAGLTMPGGEPTRAAAAIATQFGESVVNTAAQPVAAAFSPGHARSLYQPRPGGGAGKQTPRAAGPGEHRLNGEGVRITLPDGSVAVAPNEQAATAVRTALSQQGVPYVWGGTTPGQGLDCSGLTQYAYREAGIDLPRLAQEQGIGHPRIDQADLMPGDLAVWDGHVAMVVGNGLMVEAGDPVQVSPVRTENLGMQFYGFYRPTE